MYYRIAVNSPKPNSLLTYSWQEEVLGELKLGSIVTVPLGRRKELGVVWEKTLTLTADELKFEIKEIVVLHHPTFILSEDQRKLFSWIANYYHYHLGTLLFDSFPSSLIVKKLKIKKMVGKGEPFPFTFSEEQQFIIDGISKLLNQGFSKHYIHGITGSGKTAIYLQLMLKMLSEGKSVLLLVPEINLTPQLLSVLSKHLPFEIYAYHSAITPAQKTLLWNFLLEESGPKIIIGARSSLFLPIQNLGIILIDEEHDGSYKQSDRCSYHARDVAIKWCQIQNIPIVMGSATPSVENYYIHTANHNQNENQSSPISHHFWSLSRRVGSASLPQIKLVDLRKEKGKKEEQPFWPLSEESILQIEKALTKKEQVLIFINRLGYAHYVQCKGCGHQFLCKNCSIKLRYFQRKDLLSCHFCQYAIPVPSHCPECHCVDLLQRGFGTEKVIEALTKKFATHTIARFDRDDLTTFNKLEERLNSFHNQEIDILVGTQMLAKGHNFQRVNLVIILGVDEQMSIPDFRSSEKLYQLLTQISGRAGRYGTSGQVLIETRHPEEPLFRFIENPSLTDFYQEELVMREMLHYPPFGRLAVLYIIGKSLEEVSAMIKELTLNLRGLLSYFPSGEIQILGPGPTMTEKRLNQFSWQLIIKSKNANSLHRMLKSIKLDLIPSSMRLKIDIDPIQFW